MSKSSRKKNKERRAKEKKAKKLTNIYLRLGSKGYISKRRRRLQKNKLRMNRKRSGIAFHLPSSKRGKRLHRKKYGY